MYERWRRVPTREPGRLVYRDGPNPFGAVLLGAGLLGLCGTAGKMAADRPEERLAYALGHASCLLLLACGARFVLRREVMFARAPARVTLSTRWPGGGRSQSHDLGGSSGAVVWRRIPDDRRLVWASGDPIGGVLLVPGGGAEILLCRRWDGEAARGMAEEAAAFLGWSVAQDSPPAGQHS